MSRWGNDWRNYKGPIKTPEVQRIIDDHNRRHALDPSVILTDIGSSKPSKYKNLKTVASDGTNCDSKREAARWEQLLLLLKAGQIADLLPHPSFPVYVNGSRVGRFTGDALYIENGRLIVEDSKSKITAAHTAYRSRLKTFLACYPHIQFREWIQ